MNCSFVKNVIRQKHANMKKKGVDSICLICSRRGRHSIIITNCQNYVSASGTPLTKFLNKIIGEEPCYSISEFVCQQCFLLLDRLDAYQARAAEIHHHISTRYKDTKFTFLGNRQRISELIVSSLSNIKSFKNGTTLNVSDELSVTVFNEALTRQEIRSLNRSSTEKSILVNSNETSSHVQNNLNNNYLKKRKRTACAKEIAKKKRKPPIALSGNNNDDNSDTNQNIVLSSSVVSNNVSLNEESICENNVNLAERESTLTCKVNVKNEGSDRESDQDSDSSSASTTSSGSRKSKSSSTVSSSSNSSSSTSSSSTSNSSSEDSSDEEDSEIKGAEITVKETETPKDEKCNKEEENQRGEGGGSEEETKKEEEVLVTQEEDKQVDKPRQLPVIQEQKENWTNQEMETLDSHFAEAVLMQNSFASNLLQSFLSTSLWMNSSDSQSGHNIINNIAKNQQSQLQTFQKRNQDDVTVDSLSSAVGSIKDKKKRLELKNTGQSYMNTKGKLVEAKRVWPQDCSRCPLKCNGRLNEEERLLIFADYWGLADYDLQREYLATHMEREERVGPSGHTRTVVFYFLTSGTKRIQVCRQFFLKTLDVSEKASRIVLEKKLKGELAADVPPPPPAATVNDETQKSDVSS